MRKFILIALAGIGDRARGAGIRVRDAVRSAAGSAPPPTMCRRPSRCYHRRWHRRLPPSLIAAGIAATGAAAAAGNGVDWSGRPAQLAPAVSFRRG